MPNVLAQPVTSYIQGRQYGQQEAQQRQQFELSQQINREQLGRMRQKGVTEAAQAKALQEAQILGAVLNQPPEAQQAAFDSVLDRLSPNTVKMFGADVTGRAAFDPNRARMLIDMASTFNKIPSEKITSQIANYQFEKGLPAEEVPRFRAQFREQPTEIYEKTAAKEAAKLKTQYKLKPQVESAVAEAVGQAKLLAKQAGDQKSNEVAWSMYDTAMNGLVEALGGTTTGPGIGFLPAVTANQQIADGAVAAMAPILKQMFRNAGEGTFTDKDQELLLKMVPTRNDRPEARKAKISNIDAIVRAKLGQGGQVPARTTPEKFGAQQQYPTPQTQEEFNALPSGSIYIDPDDGKQYRKP